MLWEPPVILWTIPEGIRRANSAGWDSDNLYVTGGVSLPRGVTVLGGKMCASDTENYAALLVQDNYGNPYAVIVLNTDSQTDLYERMEQMLEAISS